MLFRSPRFLVLLSGKYWLIVAVDENGEQVGDITSRSVFDETLEIPMDLQEQALVKIGRASCRERV